MEQVPVPMNAALESVFTVQSYPTMTDALTGKESFEEPATEVRVSTGAGTTAP